MQINENKAGIYIHIPFCKQACTYCNFHFSTSLRNKEEMIAALITEIVSRQNYTENKHIQSIYFGGGTPSILHEDDIKKILFEVHNHFPIDEGVEITLEANPDDIEQTKILALRKAGINRISLGIQSFIDRDLLLMHRSHDAKQAEKSLQLIKDAGFENITADLIYGIPGQSHEEWLQNIEILIKQNIDHISCYALTVEPKTALQHQIIKKKIAAPDDKHTAEQFELLVEHLQRAGFEHYEISNFAKNKKYSKHNTSYWFGNWYVGFGPSAHSFNGISRQWNVSNNMAYISGISNKKNVFEVETLTTSQQINEYIMISLRTMWGLNKNIFKQRFGETQFERLMSDASQYIRQQLIDDIVERLIITKKGKFISDAIISDLFFMEEG